jgi:protease IV
LTVRKVLLGCSALAALLLVGGLSAALAGGGSAGKARWWGGDRVAVLPIHGVIGSDEAVLAELRAFVDDPSVRAIVLSIDSPGGAVAPSQSVYQELRKVREQGMPVVASILSIGASGGYYIALAADSIVALPGSLTGSIGVIMEFPNATELLGKLGVRMEVVKSSDHKDIGSPFRAVSDRDRLLLQGMITDVYDQFVEVVVYERQLADDSVRSIADGRLFSGRQALDAGLVDRQGNLVDAIAIAGRMAGLGDEPDVLLPPAPRRSLLEVLLGVRVSDLADRLRAGADQVHGPRLRFVAR